MKNKPTYVTMPSLPPIEDYTEILKSAWESGVLTHNGPIVQRLEKEVDSYLNTKSTVAVTNGTIALQMAIKALDLKGEIITSPFTWIATASAIRWEGCEPVFVDIDSNTLNIDPSKIEAAITSRTVAIMPVHVFSNPCDIDAIEAIAKKYGLKVIYDAAHAFGVNYNNKSIMDAGDISCTSWHATKLFNSGEGGACHTLNEELKAKLQRLRFFGHDANKDIVEDGLNGKLTEIHAALGLANIANVNEVIEHRKAIYNAYYEGLNECSFIRFQSFDPAAYNYSYMPIIFDSEERMNKALKALADEQIYARRYFYPSLNTIKAVKQYTPCPVSEDIASRIVCLPSHQRINDSEISTICSIIRSK